MGLTNIFIFIIKVTKQTYTDKQEFVDSELTLVRHGMKAKVQIGAWWYTKENLQAIIEQLDKHQQCIDLLNKE